MTETIDKSSLPRHVAIIMDGNGRWAKARGLDRSEGHVEGVNTVRRITEMASELDLIKNNVRLRMIGDSSRMPKEAYERLQQCIADTSHGTGLTLTLAISYSSRWEIAEACRRFAADVAEGKRAIADMDGDAASERYLTTDGMPDPDLLIRTGGDHRVSNFLLWQIAYSEIYVTDTYWPDFSREDFVKALRDFRGRERRFGLTSEQLKK